MSGVAIAFAIWGCLTGTVGVVMALARTGPDEAVSNLSKWIEKVGLHRLAFRLRSPVTDRRVFRAGLIAMATLLFIGGVGVGMWLNSSGLTAPPTPGELDRTKHALPAAPSQAARSQANLTQEDIATKIDIWRSVYSQMDDFAKALNLGDDLIKNWLKLNRSDALTATTNFRTALADADTRLDALRIAYPNYIDVSTALNNESRPNIFGSIESFRQALSSLSEERPKNYENIIRPYSNILKHDLDEIWEWQSSIRRNAMVKSEELSKADQK
jgi:transcriptional regulator with XRE-family HTH domain